MNTSTKIAVLAGSALLVSFTSHTSLAQRPGAGAARSAGHAPPAAAKNVNRSPSMSRPAGPAAAPNNPRPNAGQPGGMQRPNAGGEGTGIQRPNAPQPGGIQRPNAPQPGGIQRPNAGGDACASPTSQRPSTGRNSTAQCGRRRTGHPYGPMQLNQAEFNGPMPAIRGSIERLAERFPRQGHYNRHPIQSATFRDGTPRHDAARWSPTPAIGSFRWYHEHPGRVTSRT